MSAARSRPGWPALLPLAVLPVAASRTDVPILAVGAVLIVTLVLWAWGARGEARAVAMLDRSNGRIGAFESWLLAGVVAVCVAYVAVGARSDQIAYNDGAYYYGVARHMARTGRFEEPIVWHWLAPPDAVLHAPFDYWGGTTSLLLAPILATFGATPEAAIVAMAVLAGVVLVAFWYLVCCALPIRHRVTQLVALVLFAFCPAMDLYRFQPESIGVVHLFVVLALIAFCRGWMVTALLCGFGILLTRSDGIVLFGVIALWCLVSEWRAGTWRVARLVLAGLACAGVYVGWSMASFGTPTPPGGRAVPFLPTYLRIYEYVPSGQRRWVPFGQRFTARYVSLQLGLAWRTLAAMPIAPVMPAWLGLACLPLVDVWRRRSLPHLLVWSMAAAYFVVAWASGTGFAVPRTPYAFVPLFVLAGALGVDVVLDGLDLALRRAPRAAAVATGGLILASSAWLLSAVPVLSTPIPYSSFASYRDLVRLDDVVGGAPVVTPMPWWLIAYSSSPALSVPHNGEAAVASVIERYRIRWLVIPPPPRGGGASRPLLDAIFDGTQTHVGAFRIEPVPVDGVSWRLYRLEPPTPLPAARP